MCHTVYMTCNSLSNCRRHVLQADRAVPPSHRVPAMQPPAPAPEAHVVGARHDAERDQDPFQQHPQRELAVVAPQRRIHDGGIGPRHVLACKGMRVGAYAQPHIGTPPSSSATVKPTSITSLHAPPAQPSPTRAAPLSQQLTVALRADGVDTGGLHPVHQEEAVPAAPPGEQGRVGQGG